MPDEPPERQYGARLLPDFASYLRKRLVEHGDGGADGSTLDAVSDDNTQYVIVHIYLIPGNATERGDLREAIHRELGKLNAIQLHDLAYAVPTNRVDGRSTAMGTWESLIYAGANATGEHDPDAWQSGDVIYVHYVGHDGMAVLAGAPRSRRRLPDAAED